MYALLRYKTHSQLTVAMESSGTIDENLFYERYEVGRELRRGNHGTTFLIMDRETRQPWAAKFVERGPPGPPPPKSTIFITVTTSHTSLHTRQYIAPGN